MKLLHLTDTHLGAKLRVEGAPKGWERAADHHAAFVRALEPAMRGEVDAVVHSGDLFDRSSPPRKWMHAAYDHLVEVAKRVPVVLIAGNHDRKGLCRWLPHGSLIVVDRAARVQLGEHWIGLVAFQRRPEVWAELAASVCEPGVSLLFAHQAFEGQRCPGLRFRVGRPGDTLGEQHLPPSPPVIASGHLHPRQVVSVGSTRVVCPGSTERTSFSEARETKGYAIWELGSRAEHRFVDLPARPRVVVGEAADLARVIPESLVSAATPELGKQAAERGGWVVPKRVWPAQRAPAASAGLSLFA